MKIAFDTPLLDHRNKPMVESGDDGKPTDEVTTLQHIAERALLAQFPDEQSLASSKKAERFKLFNQISGPVGVRDWDLTADQVVMLKECIGKGFGPLIYGRTVVEIIEPAERDAKAGANGAGHKAPGKVTASKGERGAAAG